MKAYLVIDVSIVDLDGFMEYAGRIPALIDKYGGKYLVQGEVPTIIEGESGIPERTVVLEFPSRESAESFLDERTSSDLHEIWARTTQSRILLVEGSSHLVDPPDKQ